MSGKEFVSTEHLLLALLEFEDSTAQRVLEALKVNLVELRRRLFKRILDADRGPSYDKRGFFDNFGTEAKKAVANAQEIARKEHLPLVGVNAILHGLLTIKNGIASEIVLKKARSGFEGFNYQFEKKSRLWRSLSG